MRTLLEASTVKLRVPEAGIDEHANVTAAAAPADKPQTLGWDAFEVWRTRVKMLQQIPSRAKRPD